MGPTTDWPTRDLLSHRAAATPQRTALIDVATDRTWTYREFDHRVDAVTTALEADSGERLGILIDTRPAFATLFFAAMRRGVTVVPLNVRETTRELATKVERTGLESIVCERDTEAAALDVADAVADGGPPSIRSVDEPGDERTQSLAVAHEDHSPTHSADAAAVEPAPLERDDTMLVMFTSGTSGDPKGVRLTIGNLVASATASAFRLGVGPDDRWLCCLPTYHMGGLAPIVRSTLYGTTAVIQREFDAEDTARVLERFEISGVSLVPTMCKRLLAAGWEPSDALRFVLLGGAPASSEFLERCHERAVPVYPTYGMTETASQIATATPAETRAHEGTVGQPLAFTDVTVVDDDGNVRGAGDTGELVVSGPTVTPGYLEDAHTDAAVTDRGLRTGDIGRRDEDGRLWILNRRSDRIVTGGENVDPGEVIDALRSAPGVEAAAVVGLSDPEWGERVGSLITPDGAGNGETLEIRSVLDHCEDRLAGFKQPKTIAVVDSLPRTASGTVDREAARARVLEDGVDITDLP
ncbi:2-succinylbenzoate--CoA ligase [Salinadaptatus halalkaliphilus]|uniref:2-succinylbenzoate--CoA ligase n=1 Tax=Salinadaptatus halalkaliphilus TaxID=2419781 RepID=A0A4S3TLI3_9EURY|nr:2-succinylbenzoate--CoA ligase [Salinadaptatus halalkaliphilus]